MNTRKQISTISYCSKDFLVNTLNRLVSDHMIANYMMIWHLPEEDEKKGHWHLWIEPNTQIDTMDLQEILTEYNENDPSGTPINCDSHLSGSPNLTLYQVQSKPLRSLPFCTFLSITNACVTISMSTTSLS